MKQQEQQKNTERTTSESTGNTFVSRLLRRLHENKCLVMLVLLLVGLVMQPENDSNTVIHWISATVFIVILAVGPYVVTGSRKILLFSIALVGLTILMEIIYEDIPLPALRYASGMILLFLEILMTAALFWYTASARILNRDLIFGSICVYFLIALSFADVFYAIEVSNPGSFVGVNVVDRAGMIDSFIYFSLVSITTLGYGDIFAVAPLPRRLVAIEACLGVMYVAIFIGRLMAVYTMRQDGTRVMEK